MTCCPTRVFTSLRSAARHLYESHTAQYRAMIPTEHRSQGRRAVESGLLIHIEGGWKCIADRS